MTIKEKIVEALAALGYSSKHVTVSVRKGGYSESVNVTIRDVAVNYARVDKAVNQFEKIDRCEVTGDILSGGNTFVSLKIAEPIATEWAKKYQADIERIFATLAVDEGASLDSRFTLIRRRNNCFKIWDEEKEHWFDGDFWDARSLAVELYIETQVQIIEPASV